MKDNKQSDLQSHNCLINTSEQPWRYVYCIAPASEETSLGEIGIDGSEVYTVVHKEICALVHDHPAQPYQTANDETAASWLLAHHQVVEAAWKRWGTVLPMTFNTIIKAGQKTAEQNLIEFLATEYEALQAKLEALVGKVEYGIQIFWDAALVAKQVSETTPEIRRLEGEILSKPRGLAYMYRQRLEGLLKDRMAAQAAEEFRGFYGRAGICADGIRVEKIKAAPEGLQMLINLSCLVSREKYPELEALTTEVRKKEGYFVRLVGPLPPYSFC